MAEPPLRLRHQDTLRALDDIDAVGIVARDLVKRFSGVERTRTGRPAADRAEHAGTAPATDLTTVTDPDTGRVCQLPTPSLHMVSVAALAIVAARELLPPGVATAAVFGTGPAARLHLRLILRYLDAVSSVTVHPAVLDTDPSAGRGAPDDPEPGITVATGADPRRTARGANLLVITELGWERLDVGQLRPGALVINASRRDLPDEMLAQVDRVVVDDIELLEHNHHRKFVRLHQAGSRARPEQDYEPWAGWHRRPAPWRYRGPIDTDLGHVLTRGGPKAAVDDVLLVELLDGGSVGACLGGPICRAALALAPHQRHDNEEME